MAQLQAIHEQLPEYCCPDTPIQVIEVIRQPVHEGKRQEERQEVEAGEQRGQKCVEEERRGGGGQQRQTALLLGACREEE